MRIDYQELKYYMGIIEFLLFFLFLLCTAHYFDFLKLIITDDDQ